MPIKKITAIIDELQWVKVEKALEVHGVTGLTVHAVKGRGNYSNTYSKDHLVDHVQIVIYTGDKHARRIATLIMQTADVGAESEGLVEITSVDELFWVHEQSLAVASEFKYFEVSRGE